MSSLAYSLIVDFGEGSETCTPVIAGEAAQSFGQLSIAVIWTCDVHSSRSARDAFSLPVFGPSSGREHGYSALMPCSATKALQRTRSRSR